jgi:hypothetical protein
LVVLLKEMHELLNGFLTNMQLLKNILKAKGQRPIFTPGKNWECTPVIT